MTSDDLPLSLKGQQLAIFGPMEKIYKFHRDIFLPALKECNENIDKISDVFHKYLNVRELIYFYYN